MVHRKIHSLYQTRTYARNEHKEGGELRVLNLRYKGQQGANVLSMKDQRNTHYFLDQDNEYNTNRNQPIVALYLFRAFL